jgi:trehalose 6-phosphate synthase/phosphatase
VTPCACQTLHLAGALPLAEFVGCSPSLSGAIRVNPWSIESVCDGMYAAVRMPREHRRLRHEKHWRYVSQHTVAYWATSFITDLQVSAWAGV